VGRPRRIFAFQGVELAVRPKIVESMAKPEYSNLETHGGAEVTTCMV